MHPQDNIVKLQSGTAVVALKCAAEGFPPPVIIWLRNNSTVVNDSVTSNGSVSTLNLVLRKRILRTCVGQQMQWEDLIPAKKR